MVHLVRLVTADDWDPALASLRLREVVSDALVLRQMSARVQRAIAERPSEVAERAARTLAAAMGVAQST
jgi:hypothetical protein